jgi:hypothetical protein
LHRPPWTSSAEVKYMGRTAIAWESASAHNLAANSHSELGFATNFNMYSESATAPAKRITGPHARSNELRDGAIGSADQCRDACVRYLELKSHISNGTAKSVGSHHSVPTQDVMAFPLTIVPNVPGAGTA